MISRTASASRTRGFPASARNPQASRRPPRPKLPTLNVATWNIHSLRQKKKRLLIADDLSVYKIDLAVLTETWTPTCTSTWTASTGHTYSFFNSGQESRGQGVAIVIDSSFNDSVADYWPVSPRLIRLRLQQGNKHVTILGAYAPVSSAPSADLAAFYYSLQQQLDLVPASDFLLLAGDFNARIGRDDPDATSSIGRWGESVQNDAGRALLTLMTSNSLRIMNPYFRHRPVHRYTYPSARSVIDFIAVRRSHHVFVTDVRVRRGTATCSDHHLVVARVTNPLQVRCATRRTPCRPPERPSIRIELLRYRHIQRIYQQRIAYAAGAADDIDTSTVDDVWQQYKTSCVQAATTACTTREGKRQRGKANAWTPELKRAVKQKRALKRELLSAHTDADKTALRQRLKMACRHIRTATRDRERQYWARAASRLQNNYHQNVKCFWRFLRKWRKPEDDVVHLPIQRSDGRAVTQPQAVRARWQEYFAGLLNPLTSFPTSTPAPPPTPMTAALETPISEEELRGAISRLHCGKSAGHDGIFPEMIILSGEAGIQWLLRLCNKCLASRTVPTDWQRSLVVPIFKKGDRRVCSNYRGISLLCVAGKVYAYVLERRLRHIVEPLLHPSQVGFRSGRGCHDGMFALREIFERRLEYGLVTHAAFIDLEKAFDSIPRALLWQTLRSLPITSHLTDAIQSFYSRAESAVRTSHGVTDWFAVTCGVRQGCVMSPLLFIIYMDAVIKRMYQLTLPLSADALTLRLVAYADDLALLTTSALALQWMMDGLSTTCGAFGLKINVSKTVTMVVQRPGESTTHAITLNGTTLERVDKFKYLGNLLTDRNDADAMIAARISAAAAEIGALGCKFFDTSTIDDNIKLCVLKQVIRPTLTYGCEAWPFTAKRARQLEVAFMRPVRLISGFTRYDQYDFSVTNQDILDSLDLDPLSTFIEMQQLRWLGHVLRMDNDAPAHASFNYTITTPTTRPAGRPATRWRDGVLRAVMARNIDVGRGVDTWDKLADLASDRAAWQKLTTCASTEQ